MTGTRMMRRSIFFGAVASLIRTPAVVRAAEFEGGPRLAVTAVTASKSEAKNSEDGGRTIPTLFL